MLEPFVRISFRIMKAVLQSGRFQPDILSLFTRVLSDDRKGAPVELDHTANDTAIIVTTRVPVRVAEHDIGSAVRTLLIGGVEQTTKIRLDA